MPFTNPLSCGFPVVFRHPAGSQFARRRDGGAVSILPAGTIA
ncbi:hypothetical protein [Methanoculleus sp. 10]|nr:hypothetical protein [Methanoculleus sp. 10]